MNYEQKYKDALEAARSIYKDMKEGFNYSGMEDLEVIFPELAESEDERIRKSIIQTLEFACAHKLVDYDAVVKMKAYLEKQKESFVSMNPAPGFDSGGISVYHESEEEIRKEIIEYLKLHDKGEDDYAHTMFSKWFAYLEKQKECFANSSKTSVSEDERTRKELIGMIKFNASDDDVDRYLAYLEKQEQTSSIPWVKSDNVTNPDKPYIDKAGWFYTTDGRMCPASEIEKQKEEEGYEAIPVESTLEYKLGFKAGKESEKRKGQEPVEESIRTKIISRAKSEKQVVLISETNDNAEIGWDTRSLRDTKNLLEYGLAFINKQLEQKPVEEQESVTDEILAKHIKAEFEGFRNLLKKKGIDYEPQQVYWDDFARLFVSSARKYVEQKPVDENQIDMNELKWQLEYWFGQVLCHYENKGCPYDDMGEVVRHFVEDASERIAKKIMRPVEWSEKDEVAMRITMDWLIEYRDRHANLEETKDEIDYCIDWLKSLRPQPQGIYQQVVKGLRDMCDCYEQNGMFTDERARDFLANVRVKCKDAIDCAPILDEPSWKPNKEQMEALESAVKLYKDTHFEIHHEKIVSLYEQLKKLM